LIRSEEGYDNDDNDIVAFNSLKT